MKKAFTLVELIVVITVLGVLSTIGFVSYIGYAEDSRDGVRVANVNDIKKSLELNKIHAGDYPTPDHSYSVGYLGKEIWKQGVIGSKTKKHIKFNAVEMDPKYDADYSYSVSSDGKRFEVGTILEDENNTPLSFLIGNTYANGSDKAFNFGNMRGKFHVTKVNGETHVFSIPSMVFNNSLNKEIIVNVPTNQFSVTGEGALPESYVGKSGANETVAFTPRLLYRGPNCGVETDQEIVNFLATLRDSFNYEPFLSNPDYKDIFNDYDILRNNMDDFETLKKLGLKINKLLDCDIKSFKTVDIFPTQCGYEGLNFEGVVDGFDIETDSCLFEYSGDGTAIVQDNAGEGNTKGLYINPVDGDGTLSYRVFTYKPFKMDYDFLSMMNMGSGYYKLYINDVEYLHYNNDLNEFENYQTPLLKPGLYDFKWVVHRHSSQWGHEGQLILDNIQFTCVGGGGSCGWSEGTLELGASNPWDLYEFSGVVGTTWSQVTGSGNTSGADDSYAIKAPVIPLGRSEAIITYKKTLDTAQKFHFDYKANLWYNGRFRFFINGIEYYTETGYGNSNESQPFKTYDSPLLPAGDYEFKWLGYRYWGAGETNLWLDNMRFSCDGGGAGCGILDETFEIGDKDFSEVMTFGGDTDLPWNLVTGSDDVSQGDYALKSPTLEPYVPYGTTQHNMTINKTFSQSTKISFDLKNQVGGGYAEFFINGIEYYQQQGTDDYHTVESPLLPAGNYEFKWVVRRSWTGANTYIWLDNIQYICEGGGTNCGVAGDGTFEKGNNSLMDPSMYVFEGAVDTPWMIETDSDYVSTGTSSLKSPGMKDHFDVTRMTTTKTLTEGQSISFDMKTYLQSNGATIRFKIGGVTYLYQTGASTGNTTSGWNNYDSGPLTAGTYEIEWEVTKHSETNIWLDNITINN